MANDDQHEHTEEHDLGLRHDLQTLRSRRGRRAVLTLMGSSVVVGSAALGSALLESSDAAAHGVPHGARRGTSAAACDTDEIPTETAGPYPGDGSNGPDVLDDTGVVRRNIRSSFGDSAGTTAQGVLTTVKLKLTDTADCAPAKGLAVYLWHCNRDGEYSMYSSGIEDENYLRGVQVTNAKGVVKFKSIYPACYSGRWPHIHYEVFADKSDATSGGTPLVTSQIALPRRQSMHVYRNAPGYSASVTNLEQTSLGTDNVFSDDGGVRELATVTGSISEGYKINLTAPVEV